MTSRREEPPIFAFLERLKEGNIWQAPGRFLSADFVENRLPRTACRNAKFQTQVGVKNSFAFARKPQQLCADFIFAVDIYGHSARLFDHLAGAAEQRQRNSDAERLGSLEVDDQFDFHGLEDIPDGS